MTSLADRSVHPYRLLVTNRARLEGWDGALRGAARRGEVVRVRPGAYLPSDVWAALSATDRHFARMHAAALTLSEPVFSHQSAAIAHGLPLLTGRLTRLHMLQKTANGSGSRADATVHAFSGDPDIVRRHGLRVTGGARTVLDLARILPHAEALAVADAALRTPDPRAGIRGTGTAPASRDELLAKADGLAGARGGWSAFLVASEADPRAESFGESFSRSVALRLGAPRPELQVAFYDADGLIGYGDMFWREWDVLGEFDGKLKYGADNPSGPPPETVVYREKLREDRLRRVCRRVVRFGWNDITQPQRFAALLSDAGVRLDPRAAWPDLRPIARSFAEHRP
jgi:hypothetical protein